jgi:hypothetical protein
MIWTFEQDGPFNGESEIRVTNRRGEVGMANIEYSPAVRVVGPVVEIVERDADGYPTREAEVIDRRSVIRNVGA